MEDSERVKQRPEKTLTKKKKATKKKGLSEDPQEEIADLGPEYEGLTDQQILDKIEEKRQKEIEKELSEYVSEEAGRMWQALQSNNEEQYKYMKLDAEGVARMKKMGRKGLEKKLYEHYREIWEKEGRIAKREEGSSFKSNLCCILFMVFFLFFLVFSKLNEETISMFGMRSDKEIVDYYETLQLEPSAKPAEIKRQYRKMAAQFHPDRNREETSKETFLKVQKAYEVLKDPRRKEIYDQSYGLVEGSAFIQSQTTMITAQNYDRLVLDSKEFWVIQVFDHEWSQCQTFSDTWESLALKYPFLRWGRIDRKSQHAMLHRLPFRPLEYPFVFLYSQETNGEFVERGREGFAKAIVRTLKEHLPTRLRIIGNADLMSMLSEGSKGRKTPCIIHINRAGFEDLLFMYESRMARGIDYFSTRNDLYGIIAQAMKTHFPEKVGKEIPKYILIHKEGSPEAKRYGGIEFVYGRYETVAHRLKYAAPPQIDIENFHHWCPLTWIPDTDNGNRLCLMVPTGEAGDQIIESIQKEASDKGTNSEFLKTNTIVRLDPSSQSYLYRFYRRMLSRDNSSLSDTSSLPSTAPILAYNPSTEGFTLIPSPLSTQSSSTTFFPLESQTEALSYLTDLYPNLPTLHHSLLPPHPILSSLFTILTSIFPYIVGGGILYIVSGMERMKEYKKVTMGLYWLGVVGRVVYWGWLQREKSREREGW